MIQTFRSPDARRREALRLYRSAFVDSGLALLVLTPDLRVAEANDAYLKATGRSRESIIDLHMFEAFPDSPHDPAADGVAKLSESFDRVLQSNTCDVMTLQRYDIQPEGRSWEIRYWMPVNWVIQDEGSTIALVHHVRDVTGDVLGPAARRSTKFDLIARADLAIHDARRTVAQVKQDLAALKRRRSWSRSESA
jgi:PAS domain-containing protein